MRTRACEGMFDELLSQEDDHLGGCKRHRARKAAAAARSTGDQPSHPRHAGHHDYGCQQLQVAVHVATAVGSAELVR